MAKYPYTVLPGKDGLVYKPLIKVVLGFQKTHKITPPILALIDSGADVCFCLEDIGAWLGIKFKTKRKMTTFKAADNKSFRAFKEEVILYVNQRKYLCPFFFTDVLPRETPLILGQRGFFNRFRIVFDYQKKIIEVV